jgi:predicted PurR-regulated permease PerM
MKQTVQQLKQQLQQTLEQLQQSQQHNKQLQEQLKNIQQLQPSITANTQQSQTTQQQQQQQQQQITDNTVSSLDIPQDSRSGTVSVEMLSFFVDSNIFYVCSSFC